MGVGAIIRNSNGQTMVALSKKVIGSLSPKGIEAKTLALSLSWAMDIGLPLHSIDTDALTVVASLKR